MINYKNIPKEQVEKEQWAQNKQFLLRNVLKLLGGKILILVRGNYTTVNSDRKQNTSITRFIHTKYQERIIK